MVQILDDDHLESLLCTKCRKYLSVFPVKNHPSRDVTCGRCSRDDDGGVRSTRYELIASRYAFRCVNRYEGCRELLRADETVEHEKKCVGSTFDCPKCRDGTARTVLGLMWHYKLRHPASYLKRNSFEVNPPFVDNDAMLYVRDDVVFFVVMRRESDAMRLSVVTLTEVEATQGFIVLRSNAVQVRTERRPCGRDFVLDDGFVIDAVEPLEVIFHLKVSSKGARPPCDLSVPSTSSSDAPEEPVMLPDATPEKSVIVPDAEPAVVPRHGPSLPVRLLGGFEKYSGYKLDDSGTALISGNGFRIDLACSNCGQWIGMPMYKCTKLKHKMCRDCKAWCGICECECVSTNSDDPLVELSGNLWLPCKWKCGKSFGSTTLHDHESSCELRIKKCPECPIEVHLKYVKHHLFYDHQKYFLERYDAGIAKMISDKTDGEVYFLLNDKWCYLKWSYKDYISYRERYNFTFRSLEPNTKLGTIYNSKCSYDNNERTRVSIDHITKVYLKFNCK